MTVVRTFLPLENFVPVHRRAIVDAIKSTGIPASHARMKQFLTLAFCIVFGTTSPMTAETATDATYIVEQHIISGNYEKKFAIIAQDTLAIMRPAFERFGAEIINSDRFLGELVGDYHLEFMSRIQKEATIAYQEILAPEELTALANFYRSDEGQKLLAQGLSAETLNDSAAFFRVGPGESILEHMPKLLAHMNEPIREAQARINELFSMNRMAEIMEMKSIIKFEDESRRQIVVDSLREAG